MSAVGWRASKQDRARLVIILLAFGYPLLSFEVPPFFSPRGERLAAFSPPVQTTATLTADAIARLVDERDTGHDSRTDMRMRLVDRQGRPRERALTLLALRGQKGAGDRLLVRFTYPNDIAGTSFLVWEQPNGEDERFLYLPALGRVRRIAGAERQESFVGSDFTYEDIGGRALDDYTYTLVDRDARWTDAAGAAHACWRLESRATDATASFPRVRSLIRQDHAVVVEAEIFDRRDTRAKHYRVTKLERIQHVWTAVELSMTNDRDRTRTEMSVTSVRYDTGLQERDFSRRELERGAR